MSAPRASRTTLSLARVSPLNTTEPASVSKRNAKEGNTGPCGTRIALTLTRSSSITVNGAIRGAVSPSALAPVPRGISMSCTSMRSRTSRIAVSRMKMLWL